MKTVTPRSTVNEPRDLPSLIRLDAITGELVWTLMRRRIEAARLIHNARGPHRRATHLRAVR